MRGRRPKPLDEGSELSPQGIDVVATLLRLSSRCALLRLRGRRPEPLPRFFAGRGCYYTAAYSILKRNSFEKGGKPESKGPKIIPRAAHNVSRDEISDSALKVLYRLNKAGYQAFLVGGCVRDALVGLHPKDFDVATDATPEEVRALFGNCRLIGRRFRLAHVRFGREIIEVATFRAAANHTPMTMRPMTRKAASFATTSTAASTRMSGAATSRAMRCTTTSRTSRSGITSAASRTSIVAASSCSGDPRAAPARRSGAHACVPFASQRSSISRSIRRSSRPSRNNVDRLSNVPAARLFDEFLKLFQSGRAEKTFDMLREHGSVRAAVSGDRQELDEDEGFADFVRAALQNTDRRVAQGKSVTPMFLLGVFFWAPTRTAGRGSPQRREDVGIAGTKPRVL